MHPRTRLVLAIGAVILLGGFGLAGQQAPEPAYAQVSGPLVHADLRAHPLPAGKWAHSGLPENHPPILPEGHPPVAGYGHRSLPEGHPPVTGHGQLDLPEGHPPVCPYSGKAGMAPELGRDLGKARAKEEPLSI